MDEDFSESFEKLSPMRIIYLTAIGVLVLISLVCNGLILAVVIKRPLLHNFPYIALSCVAVVDILNALLVLEYQILGNFPFNFPLKNIACRFYFYLPYVTSLVFALCISAIALVRWRARERFQFGEEKDVRRSVLVVVLIWLVSAALYVPNFYYVEVVNYGVESSCVDQLGFIAKYIVEVVSSVFKLGVCSILIITALLMAKRRQNERVVEEQEKRVQLDRRFDCMILIVWTIFFLLELSCGIITSLAFLNSHEISFQVINIGVKVLCIFELFSESYKIFLYRRMDEHFRKELSTMLHRN